MSRPWGPGTPFTMTTLRVIQADITTLEVDAIVNAANSRLAGGGGVDGAIHRAGGPSILAECKAWIAEHGSLPTGEAMVTSGGQLPSRFVIHTVGPIYGMHPAAEARRLLSLSYISCLDLAAGLGCESVAFPNISTGVYGYPKEEAAEVAVEAVSRVTESLTSVESVTFVCFNEDNERLYSALLES